MSTKKNKVPVWIYRDAHAILKRISAREERPILDVLTSIIRNLDESDVNVTKPSPRKDVIAPYGGVYFA